MSGERPSIDLGELLFTPAIENVTIDLKENWDRNILYFGIGVDLKSIQTHTVAVI